MANAKRSWGLIAESVVIVASILLAFAIQALWDERQEQITVERLLSSFLAEYQNNVELVREDLRYRRAVKRTTLQLFELAASPSPPDTKVVDELIGGLFWVESPNATWGALESLVTGSQLELIENVELRERLASLHTDRVTIERVDEEETTNLVEIITFLRTNASMPQLANTAAAQRKPGTNEVVYEYNLPLRATRDHSELLGNSEFLGHLVRKLWHQLDATNRNERFLAESESLVALVQIELGFEDGD
jgi:hypothetical protein